MLATGAISSHFLMFFVGVWCLKRGCWPKEEGLLGRCWNYFCDVVGEGTWKCVATVICEMKGHPKSPTLVEQVWDVLGISFSFPTEIHTAVQDGCLQETFNHRIILGDGCKYLTRASSNHLEHFNLNSNVELKKTPKEPVYLGWAYGFSEFGGNEFRMLSVCCTTGERIVKCREHT